ncbi:DNA-processing protein DprA [Ramlibacter sp. MAHUQ-53]|uniref:DNA-processing protein DprA n=1 Tax=unclassified Ramlibacter TaxID=2617605 RepID=UPI003632E7A8
MDAGELSGWLRLALAPRLGGTAARRLLAAFGLPQQVLDAPDAELSHLLSPAQLTALREPSEALDAQATACAAWLAADPARRRVLSLADATYPPALLHTADPPLLLWVAGEQPDAPWPEAIAVVGSRNPTPQGQDHARQFARSFAQAGWCVVSGLALGIDAAAHEGALEGAGSDLPCATIAVVGTGLDRVYPRAHLDLARRIAARGRLVGEYPLGTPPLPANFPRRNRLIAALSGGTLVVEAALRSGSLVTARCASEQGREVFAIPGSIHSPLSRGCHALIRQGATLVENAQDVLGELAPQRCAPDPVAADPHEPPEDGLLEALGFDPASLDALTARTGLPTPQLQARLLELELQGAVVRLAGGLFQRAAAA